MAGDSARPVVAFVPPACCGAGYFRRLTRILGGSIDIRLVELPGRGRRYQEPRITQAALVAQDITRQLGGTVDAIYGESLGAYVALAAIDQVRSPMLFAASNSAPCTRGPVVTHAVDSIGTAVAGLAALGGEIHAEATMDPVFANGAFPLVRDDLLLSWSLINALRGAKITADVRVLAGDDDSGVDQPEAWSAHTTGRCDVIRLPGEHLLSASNPSGVAKVVLETLS